MANIPQPSYHATGAATTNQWRFGLFDTVNDAGGPLFRTQDHAYLLPRNAVNEEDDMEELDGAGFGMGGAYSGSVPASIALVSFNLITLFVWMANCI